MIGRLGDLLTVCLTLAGLALSPVGALALTGREIMEEREGRHESDTEVALFTMVVRSAGGEEKVRRLVIQSATDRDGADRSLIKFLEPRDVRNVGLLTWQRPGPDEDDQWLYLEASQQTRRIVGSAKKNSFMGTDLSFEDLRPEDLKVHEYALKGEELLDGAKTWIVEATPATEAERRDSGYAKRVFWIRQDNFMTLKVSYRDRRDRELKTATYSDLEQIAGELWRANRSVVTTASTGSSTASVVDHRELGVPIDDSTFLPQNIDRRPRQR